MQDDDNCNQSNRAGTQLEFDCIAKAEREGQPEPFSLIASDPLAADMIRLWATFSRGDILTAIQGFAHIVNGPALQYISNPRRNDKIENAIGMAEEMDNWRIEKGLETFGC